LTSTKSNLNSLTIHLDPKRRVENDERKAQEDPLVLSGFRLLHLLKFALVAPVAVALSYPLTISGNFRSPEASCKGVRRYLSKNRTQWLKQNPVSKPPNLKEAES